MPKRKIRASNVNELELLTRNGILSDSSRKGGIQRSSGQAVKRSSGQAVKRSSGQAVKRSACIPSVYINAYLFRAFSGGCVIMLKTPLFFISFQ